MITRYCLPRLYLQLVDRVGALLEFRQEVVHSEAFIQFLDALGRGVDVYVVLGCDSFVQQSDLFTKRSPKLNSIVIYPFEMVNEFADKHLQLKSAAR